MECQSAGVDQRRVARYVLPIAAGVVTAWTIDAAPTGDPRFDAIFVALFGAAIAALIVRSSAISVVPLLLVGVGAQTNVAAVAYVVAVLCLAGSWQRWPRRIDARPVGAILGLTIGSVALTQALFEVRDFGYERFSALAVAIAFVCLGVGAWHASSYRARRWSIAVIGGCALVVGVISLATASEVSRYRLDVEVAADHGADAADAMVAGDLDQAEESLERAQDDLFELQANLDGGWTKVARVLPILGPNVRAMRQATNAAVEIVDAGLIVAVGENPMGLLEDGGIDVDRAEGLRRSLASATAPLERGRQHLRSIENVWLAPELSREVSALSSNAATLSEAVAATVGGLDHLPALAGYIEPRTYLFLIANPAEARDLGGFAAGYGVVSAENGRFTLLESGRPGDLDESPGTPGDLVGSYPLRFLEAEPWHYGQNLTAVPDLPTVARAVGDLFPRMAGVQVDGVVYIDTFALEALVSVTGPVRVPDYDIELNATNTADFFVADQYELFPRRVDRNNILELFVASFVEQIGTVDAHGMNKSQLRRMADVLSEGRLALAPTNAAELAALDQLGVSGAVQPIAAGQDFLAVSHSNGGPNKLDAYLERSIDYDAVVDAETGALSGTVRITLTNEVPDGRSGYEINNTHGVPAGTNRAVLVVHTPHRLIGSQGAEPEPALTRSFREFDRWRHERVVWVAPGESVTVELQLAGEASPGDDYELVLGHQPLVTTDDLTVRVDAGGSVVAFSGLLRSDFVLRAQ